MSIGFLIQTVQNKAFRGHVSNSCYFVEAGIERWERSCDSKFSETRLAIPSDQDVVLGVLRHQHVRSLIHSVCSPERYYHGEYLTQEDTSGHGMPVQADAGMVSRSPSSISRQTATYQCQPTGIRVRLGVLGDVPIRHPWTHDAKQRRCL